MRSEVLRSLVYRCMLNARIRLEASCHMMSDTVSNSEGIE